MIKLVEMRPEDLAEFGPTDDSILEVAAQTGRAVVTGDRELGGRLTQEQIRVIDRYEILAHWQKQVAQEVDVAQRPAYLRSSAALCTQ